VVTIIFNEQNLSRTNSHLQEVYEFVSLDLASLSVSPSNGNIAINIVIMLQACGLDEPEWTSTESQHECCLESSHTQNNTSSAVEVVNYTNTTSILAISTPKIMNIITITNR
jgi:hypothetical protein